MAQQSIIDSVLKEKEFKEGDDQDQCPICLAQFNPKETIYVLPCQHGYHRTCVEQWLRERSPTCPVCRHTIAPEVQDEAIQLQRIFERIYEMEQMAVAEIRSRNGTDAEVQEVRARMFNYQ